MQRDIDGSRPTDRRTPGRNSIRQLMAPVPSQFASLLQVLASVTHTSADDWESLDGPDSGVGVDYWFRHGGTGKEAYLNRDQDHLTHHFSRRAAGLRR